MSPLVDHWQPARLSPSQSRRLRGSLLPKYIYIYLLILVQLLVSYLLDSISILLEYLNNHNN